MGDARTPARRAAAASAAAAAASSGPGAPTAPTAPPEHYHPSILHEPTHIDPDGPVAKVKALLLKKLRLRLADTRIVIGVFSAYDKPGHIVLTDAEETYQDQQRAVPMVIVPLTYVRELEVEVPAHA
jgi:small nuclear ribonucleoprotein (snRNP)-like protein